MTKLELAFTEAAKLPPSEQDALAEWILEELTSEKLWEEVFARSPNVLERLADEAIREHQAGRTEKCQCSRRYPVDPRYRDRVYATG